MQEAALEGPCRCSTSGPVQQLAVEARVPYRHLAMLYT